MKTEKQSGPIDSSRGIGGEEVVHELSREQSKCPRCGQAGRRSGSKQSVQIHREVCLCQRIHKRQRYVFDCSCRQQANAREGPCRPTAVRLVRRRYSPRGCSASRFWTQVLTEKFPLQRPLHRIGKLLEVEGCAVSGGTLKRLPEDWRRRYGYTPCFWKPSC